MIENERKGAMDTMEINLTDKQRAFINEQAAQGGHASAGDYLVSLVKEAQKKSAWEIAEQLVMEGLESPAEPLTREDWKALRERIHHKAPVDNA